MEVEPIKDKEDIRRIYHWLNQNATPREAECWLIGCNIALRAGDLLRIKFEDIEGKTHLDLSEHKTGKFKKIPITDVVRDSVRRLREYYGSRDFYKSKKFVPTYLFQSTSNRAYNTCKPICIQWLSEKIKQAGKELGIPYNICTHSMRKTWGYQAYESGADIHYIQALYNHANQRITLAYIGITRAAIEQLYIDNTISVF